jgi:hypothetical protein
VSTVTCTPESAVEVRSCCFVKFPLVH